MKNEQEPRIPIEALALFDDEQIMRLARMKLAIASGEVNDLTLEYKLLEFNKYLADHQRITEQPKEGEIMDVEHAQATQPTAEEAPGPVELTMEEKRWVYFDHLVESGRLLPDNPTYEPTNPTGGEGA